MLQPFRLHAVSKVSGRGLGYVNPTGPLDYDPGKLAAVPFERDGAPALRAMLHDVGPFVLLVPWTLVQPIDVADYIDTAVADFYAEADFLGEVAS